MAARQEEHELGLTQAVATVSGGKYAKAKCISLKQYDSMKQLASRKRSNEPSLFIVAK